MVICIFDKIRSNTDLNRKNEILYPEKIINRGYIRTKSKSFMQITVPIGLNEFRTKEIKMRTISEYKTFFFSIVVILI